MPRWLPWLLLLLLPCFRFPGALPGSRVVSADDHLSVHHVFQTEAGGRVRHPQLSDPALQFSALRSQVVSAFERGEPPLWNPDIWAGAPLIGDGQSSAGSPTTWFRLFLPEDMAQDVSVLWVMIWTGLGTALLCRRLGAEQWGACAAGAAAMMGPYTQVWLLHPHAATFSWLPWALLSLESRAPVGLALATAGMLMGGHPETAAHSLLFVGLWALARSSQRTAIAGLPIGALLAAPIVLPLAEEVLRSSSLQAHGGNHLQWSQLLDLMWPGWHGHPALESWTRGQGSWADGRLHPGLGILALAAMALVRRHRQVRWLWLAWLLCILAACTGLYGPMNHARLGAMGAWFLAVSGGLGLGALQRRWRPALFGVVAATSIWACWNDQGSVEPDRHAPEPAAWTQQLREALACDEEGESPDGCGRILGLGWAVQPNTGSLAGLRDIRGYDLPVSWDTERLQRTLREHPVRPWFQVDALPSAELMRFLGIRAVVSPEPISGLPKMTMTDAPLAVHPLPMNAPRAWLATAPVQAPDPDQAADMLTRNPSRSSPPVVGLPGQWVQEGEVLPASILEDSPNRVSVGIETSVPAVLVLADAWHPGWTATNEEGASLQVLQVAGIFRGVVVRPDTQTVVFDFRPDGWFWGLRLGGLGITLLVMIAWWNRRAMR